MCGTYGIECTRACAFASIGAGAKRRSLAHCPRISMCLVMVSLIIHRQASVVGGWVRVVHAAPSTLRMGHRQNGWWHGRPHVVGGANR